VGRAGSNLAELRVRVLTAGGQVEAVVLAVQLRLDLLLFQEPPVLQELIVSELLLVLSLLEIEGGVGHRLSLLVVNALVDSLLRLVLLGENLLGRQQLLLLYKEILVGLLEDIMELAVRSEGGRF
jgi:hypothetical protein